MKPCQYKARECSTQATPVLTLSSLKTHDLSLTSQEWYHSTTEADIKSNVQVEECTKIVKCTVKKCFDTNVHINIALLQIRSPLVGLLLPSPPTLLFSRPIRGPVPKIDRTPITCNNDKDHHTTLKYAKPSI